MPSISNHLLSGASAIGLWLGLGFVTSESILAGAPASGYRVEFDRAKYSIQPGETFVARIIVTPAPPPGLFSFGVRIAVGAGGAEIRGASDVTVASELAFSGPRGSPPVVAVGTEFAAAKGTAEFFASDRPALSSVILVGFMLRDLRRGPYTLTLDFFNTLGPTEQIFVDAAGTALDSQIKFGRAEVIYGPTLEVDVIRPVALNRQTGLFDQIVRIRNIGATPVPGVRVFATALPIGWVFWNAHGNANGVPFVEQNRTLPAGGFVDLRLEYRIPGREPNGTPQYSVEIAFPSDLPSSPPSTPFALSPKVQLPDRSFLLEFSSLSNRQYLIEYSYDLTNWTASTPTVQGNGSRVQWIDYGPPRTDTAPKELTNRFYRVFLLP